MGSYILFICTPKALSGRDSSKMAAKEMGVRTAEANKIDKRRVENKSSSIANWNGSASERRNKEQCQNVSPTYLSPVLMANSVSIFPP